MLQNLPSAAVVFGALGVNFELITWSSLLHKHLKNEISYIDIFTGSSKIWVHMFVI